MTIPRPLIGSSVVALVVLLLAGGAYVRLRGANDAEADNLDGENGERPEVSATSSFSTAVAIPVSGAAARRGTLVLSVTASAQAAAQRQAVLSARVAGRVMRLLVRENQRVGAGQLLMEIDSTEYVLNVREAEAARARAEADYRALTLFDDQIEDRGVRAERDRIARAKSGYDGAQVALERAKLELARTRITAPFGGRAATINFVEGQDVNVGDEILTVIDLDPIKVEGQVLEGEVGYVSQGGNVAISFSAFPGETFTGTVATINPVVEAVTRTARVTVQVRNPDGRILPGMYAKVWIDAQEFHDRLLVPRSAVIERDRRPMLFVFDGDESVGLAKWRYVTPGLMNDSLVELLDDPETDTVQPGEVVLTDGHLTLTHDAQVRLVGNVREAGGRPR